MPLRLTDSVDLDVYYNADHERFDDSVRRVVTREAFKAFYAGCPSIGFECDGVAIGGVIFDGTTAHIAVLSTHHGRWARLLKPMLRWLFSQKEEIIVTLEEDNRKGIAFVERCGWPCIGECDGQAQYRMTARGGRPVARIDDEDPCADLT